MSTNKMPDTLVEGKAGELATFAAATLLAIGSFADKAAAEVVRPGCYTDGFGSIYAPSHVVDENGENCSAFTPEEMKEMRDNDGGDNDRNGGGDTDTDEGDTSF